MAKSISLESTLSFKGTDAGLSKILFDFQKTLTSTVDSDSVQYGEVALFDTTEKTINIQAASAGHYLYVEVVEDEDASEVTILNGATAFSTLANGEFIFVKLRGASDVKFKLNVDNGQARCKYFLIEY